MHSNDDATIQSVTTVKHQIVRSPIYPARLKCNTDLVNT